MKKDVFFDMEKAKRINTLDEFAAVPFKEKFAYFFGEMGSQSLFYYLVLTLSVFFYTDVMHISASVIGIVVIVSRVFDLCTDLIIGTLIDRTKSKFGKARFWCLFMTIPYAVSMFLLYCVPASWSTSHQIAYVIITYNLAVTICYTFENIPWGTLSTLISRDKIQRGQLSALRMAGSPLACALGIGIALPAITALGGTQRDWQTVMGIFGLVGIIVNFVCIFTIKERVKDNNPPEKNKLDVPATLQNKYWWMNILFVGLYNGFNTLFSTFLPYYCTYVLNDTLIATTLNYVQFITMAVVALASIYLIKKMDNLVMIRIGMVIAIVGQIFSILAPESLTMLIVSCIIRSIGWGFYAALLHALIGDAIEYGHWRTGHRAPGTTYSAQGIGNKLGILVGGGVTTLILGMSGYDGALAVQSASAMAAIRGIYLYLPLAFSVVFLIILAFYKLNKKTVDKLVNDISEGNFHPKAKYKADETISADAV